MRQQRSEEKGQTCAGEQVAYKYMQITALYNIAALKGSSNHTTHSALKETG